MCDHLIVGFLVQLYYTEFVSRPPMTNYTAVVARCAGPVVGLQRCQWEIQIEFDFDFFHEELFATVTCFSERGSMLL